MFLCSLHVILALLCSRRFLQAVFFLKVEVGYTSGCKVSCFFWAFCCVSFFYSWHIFVLFLLPVFSRCRFMKSAPMFLDRNFKHLTKVTNFLPPFGFKTQGKKHLCRRVGPHLVFEWKCLQQHIWNCFLSRSRRHFNSLIKIKNFTQKCHVVSSTVEDKYRIRTYTHRVIQNDPSYSFGLKGRTPINLLHKSWL